MEVISACTTISQCIASDGAHSYREFNCCFCFSELPLQIYSVSAECFILCFVCEFKQTSQHFKWASIHSLSHKWEIFLCIQPSKLFSNNNNSEKANFNSIRVSLAHRQRWILRRSNGICRIGYFSCIPKLCYERDFHFQNYIYLYCIRVYLLEVDKCWWTLAATRTQIELDGSV